MEVSGKLVSRKGRTVTIELDDDVNFDLFTKSVGVNLRDERTITTKQRNFAYGLMADIAKSDIGGYWAGDRKEIENYFKAKFCLDNDTDYFSLSTKLGNRYDTNLFIDLLLRFAIKHNVNLSYLPLNELDGDFGRRFEYLCLINKKCVICGVNEGIEFAHIDTVGFTNSRKQMNHMGKLGMALCHKHHMQQHSANWGLERFMNYYHISGTPVDERIAKIYHLNTKEK